MGDEPLPEETYVPLHEAARLSKLSSYQLTQAIREGAIGAKRAGRALFVRHQDIMKLRSRAQDEGSGAFLMAG
jgi:hypothetical protein